MKNYFIALLLCCAVFNSLAQDKNGIATATINPKGNWFFGVEVGATIISSFSYNEEKKSFQGGLLVEYYIGNKWSVTGRIKYFKIGQSTGVVYNANSSVDLTYYRRFDGEALSIPLNLKWEYKIIRNFRGNLKFGFALNQETNSKYEYKIGENTDYPFFFIDYNFGIGISYFINKKLSIYLEGEFKGLGRERYDTKTFILPASANNSFSNFGIKYNFKK